MSESSDVSISRLDDHVHVVTMQRPPNNYFDTPLLRSLADAYEELASGSCRAIVLRAEGKHFCAGLDFAANADQRIEDLYDEALRVFAAPLPVIAAVQGAAIGGGFGLALSADFRVATAASRFSANFAQLGFHHGFGLTVTLPRLTGHQIAADLLLTGRRLDGRAAHAVGLCDDLVDADDLLAAARARAERLADAGPLAVRAIRSTLRLGLVDQLREAMAHEAAEQARLRGTADFAEGVAASAARRPARFIGS